VNIVEKIHTSLNTALHKLLTNRCQQAAL